jgi:hypothetical protein
MIIVVHGNVTGPTAIAGAGSSVANHNLASFAAGTLGRNPFSITFPGRVLLDDRDDD